MSIETKIAAAELLPALKLAEALFALRLEVHYDGTPGWAAVQAAIVRAVPACEALSGGERKNALMILWHATGLGSGAEAVVESALRRLALQEKTG